MLEKVKMSLRITSTAFDVEISDLIEAAKIDLTDAGVIVDDANTKHLLAITTFVKKHFGAVEEKNYERLDRAYNNLKINLSLLKVT